MVIFFAAFIAAGKKRKMPGDMPLRSICSCLFAIGKSLHSFMVGD